MDKLKNLLLPFLVICALIFSFKVAIVPTYAEQQKPANNTEENNNTEKEEIENLSPLKEDNVINNKQLNEKNDSISMEKMTKHRRQ